LQGREGQVLADLPLLIFLKGGGMNLRAYYQKIRDVAVELEEDEVWVESVATADGGRAGLFTQVARHLAAKLIVDGKAKLAKSSDGEAYEKKRAGAQQGPLGVDRMVVTLEGSDGKARKPRS
jgi:hypothetical protein